MDWNRLIAFGLVVLIWLVQLVIYPSFREIEPVKFVAWHSVYTRRILWIVGPLMLSQVMLQGWVLWRSPRIPLILATILVAICWAVTAWSAVPLHNALQTSGYHTERIDRLVQINWIRTVAWTSAFGLLWL